MGWELVLLIIAFLLVHASSIQRPWLSLLAVIVLIPLILYHLFWTIAVFSTGKAILIIGGLIGIAIGAGLPYLLARWLEKHSL